MEEIFKKLEDKGFEVVVGYREKQRKKDMSEAMKKIKPVQPKLCLPISPELR